MCLCVCGLIWVFLHPATPLRRLHPGDTHTFQSRTANTCRSDVSHIALVFSQDMAFLYLDGELAASDATFYDELCTEDTASECAVNEQWAGVVSSSGKDFRVQLLSSAATSYTSASSYVNLNSVIYLTAIYDVALTSSEVLQNYQAGLPNSKPVVFDVNATVWEDGEVLCGSLYFTDPAAYSTAFNVSLLDVIYLPVFDLDNADYHPNYDASISGNPALLPRMYVETLPDAGKLYDSVTNKEIVGTGTGGGASQHHGGWEVWCEVPTHQGRVREGVRHVHVLQVRGWWTVVVVAVLSV